MKLETEQVLCRFHLTNLVRHGSEPLYHWILATARHDGLQGATLLEGFMGLRADGAILSGSVWRLSQELPMILEVVDEPRLIETLLAHVEPSFHSGMITLERARVVLYRVGGPTQRRYRAEPGDIVAMHDGAAQQLKTMRPPEDGILMRIFIGEGDHDESRDLPLYESILARAREAQLACVTMFKGVMGFGKNSRIHTARLLALSRDLPVVIEIVDTEERIESFVRDVDELVDDGMVTLEALRIIKYASPAAG